MVLYHESLRTSRGCHIDFGQRKLRPKNATWKLRRSLSAKGALAEKNVKMAWLILIECSLVRGYVLGSRRRYLYEYRRYCRRILEIAHTIEIHVDSRTRPASALGKVLSVPGRSNLRGWAMFEEWVLGWPRRVRLQMRWCGRVSIVMRTVSCRVEIACVREIRMGARTQHLPHIDEYVSRDFCPTVFKKCKLNRIFELILDPLSGLPLPRSSRTWVDGSTLSFGARDFSWDVPRFQSCQKSLQILKNLTFCANNGHFWANVC